MSQQTSYPTRQLDRRKAELRASGRRVYDFGTGDPPEPTPEFIRRAMVESVPAVSQYPSVDGTGQLRAAAAEYLARRFGVGLDPERDVLPTAGSKETVFHLPMMLVEPGSERDLVVYGEPAYAVFAIATRYAGARTHTFELTAANQYLMSPADIGADALDRTAVVFLNYPHNPSGQEMPGELFQEWVEARERHGFVLVSDECYCDVFFDAPPRSVLEFGHVGCLAIHSLSKRSGMTGYLSGFLAGDPELLARVREFRAASGVVSPVWTEAAAAAAWSEPDHVEQRRALFAEKRVILLELLAARGISVYPGTSTLFLWVEVPQGETDIEYAERLLESGIIVSPGSFYGAAQSRFVRVALVPSVEECREVAELWPTT